MIPKEDKSLHQPYCKVGHSNAAYKCVRHAIWKQETGVSFSHATRLSIQETGLPQFNLFVFCSLASYFQEYVILIPKEDKSLHQPYCKFDHSNTAYKCVRHAIWKQEIGVSFSHATRLSIQFHMRKKHRHLSYYYSIDWNLQHNPSLAYWH